ncbi:hypothetical protein GQ55_6G248500 [Panicum hallii var. hallii]|uniref:non-specific serine/threonine protein kinase n=1 Tax=Panicum hallii var. hallii TaxID=1504633 RepID=A0A2T7D9D1_9POAL|nr:hypothetical protein GQ55_6G248500 [Panicum hallii var. hallii]PUZ52167.1 hypothetical protein GQ55_6G248500 [Panicum hallii var. hallii]
MVDTVKHILPNYGSLTGGTRPRSRTATWWPSSALGRRSPRDTRTSRPRRRCSAGSATPTCWLSGPANLGPKGEKLLVFDYMPKGSLTSFLHPRAPNTPVDWAMRMTIAKGTARGLAYLHNDMSIVHGNLTARNVLLEEQCNPKISNFGLTRMAQAILLLYKLCLLWSCSAVM